MAISTAKRPTTKQRKFLLDEKDLPTHWYNIQADLPVPLPPPLHPGTGQPIGPADLAPLFPMELIKQEVSRERWIEIPEPVRDAYKVWRPTPLIRALGLEKVLGTPARIYYKWEGVSPAGSHKPNTAIAQAYYNKAEGTKRLATETGAGQWGSALALAARMFDLECKVYLVRVSYDQKPYRRILMETWGAEVVPSPSPDTNAGRAALAKTPRAQAASASRYPKPSRTQPRATTRNIRSARCSTTCCCIRRSSVKRQRSSLSSPTNARISSWAASAAARISAASRSRSSRTSSPARRTTSASSRSSRWPHRVSPRVGTSTTSVTKP